MTVGKILEKLNQQIAICRPEDTMARTSSPSRAKSADRIDGAMMSVNPGFGGQKFLPSALDKISVVADLIGDRPIDIEIDGGVGPANAQAISQAGANVLVAGSAVFGQGSYDDAIAKIRTAADTSTPAT